jgi:hypothetical protein
MHQDPMYESIDREKAEKTIGIGLSGKALYLEGGHSSTFQDIEAHIGQRLLLSNPPYLSIDDVMYDKLKIKIAWEYEGSTYESRLLLMIFAPNFFRLERPEISGNGLFLTVSALRNPSGPITVTVIGKKSKEISFRKIG